MIFLYIFVRVVLFCIANLLYVLAIRAERSYVQFTHEAKLYESLQNIGLRSAEISLLAQKAAKVFKYAKTAEVGYIYCQGCYERVTAAQTWLGAKFTPLSEVFMVCVDIAICVTTFASCGGYDPITGLLTVLDFFGPYLPNIFGG